MQLSIGVPTFNQAVFLGETLESLLLQTEPFAEIVVSENHCTDDTVRVLEQFQGRVRVVRPPSHLHAVGNWNYTLRQMRGDWVTLLSSDDLALPNFARDVRRTVEATPDAVVLRAAWIEMDAAGRTKEERHLNVQRVTLPERALYEQRFGPRASFAAFAVRRDISEKVGGFSEETTIIGDWAMWLLAGALGKTVYCDTPIAKYRGGHQEEIVRRRRHVHASEMFIVYDQILPRAAELAGLGRPAWIAEACRRQFRNWVGQASRDFGPGERQEMVESFSPWARSLGEEKLLDRFAAGEVLREGLLRSGVASLLRPLGRRAIRALRSAGMGLAPRG